MDSLRHWWIRPVSCLIALALSSAMMTPLVTAQDAPPDSSPETQRNSQQATSSITREEWNAELDELFPFTEPARQGGTVILGDSSDISTINALLANDNPTLDITGLINESLVALDPSTGQPVPGLADSWEVAPDGLTYTFHLNEDAAWHDGVDLSAEDVAFSFERQSDPKTGSSYTGTFTRTVDSWEVLDEHTIEVTATDVLADFLLDAYCPIMPKHIWESVAPDQWATDDGSTGEDPARVVGSGPFRFTEWEQGDHVTLTSNPNYYDGPPNIDELIFRVWPNDAQAIEALRSGEIDIVRNIPAPDTRQIKNSDGLDVAIYPTFGFGFYAYNLDTDKTTLFEDVEVRQALFYALDRESIVNDIYLGYGEVAHGSQPLLSFAYAPNEVETIYGFDPNLAMQILDDADWVDTNSNGIRDKDGQELAFELSYPTGTPTTDQLVAYMQQAWAEIGVEMTPKPMEYQALIDIVSETYEYEVALLALDWDTTGNQSAMFNCDQYKVGFNLSKYCNTKVDELNNKARTTLDAEERRELLIESMNIVNDDLPVAVLLFRNDRTGFNDNLENFFPTSVSLLWSLRYVWVDQ